MLFFFFFFKQKTAYEMRISDWSSDVCSSDLVDMLAPGQQVRFRRGGLPVGKARLHDRMGSLGQGESAHIPSIMTGVPDQGVKTAAGAGCPAPAQRSACLRSAAGGR